MKNKGLILLCLAVCLVTVSLACAEDPVRVKCDRFTMNVPSENVKCYQTDDNIVLEEGATPDEIAKAQVANTAIYFSNMDSLSSAIPPQVTFYQIDDLGKTSFELLDVSLSLQDMLDNISSGFMDPADTEDEVPFLPYQTEPRLVSALIKQLDFENGSGIRSIGVFTDTVNTSGGFSNLFYSFQGISSDGMYYISAVFPLRNNSLDQKETAAIDWKTISEDGFLPTLQQLDYYVSSIVIE